MKAKLTHNAKYEAEVTLSFIEVIGSNTQIEERLTNAGFTNVTVIGNGNKRKATGTWSGSTMDVEVPKQITAIKEL